jgi:hypothetical protein
MNKFFSFATSTLLLLSAGDILADDKGRYFCNDCELTGVRGVAIGAASEEIAFIKSVVNATAFSQTPGQTIPTSG